MNESDPLARVSPGETWITHPPNHQLFRHCKEISSPCPRLKRLFDPGSKKALYQERAHPCHPAAQPIPIASANGAADLLRPIAPGARLAAFSVRGSAGVKPWKPLTKQPEPVIWELYSRVLTELFDTLDQRDRLGGARRLAPDWKSARPRSAHANVIAWVWGYLANFSSTAGIKHCCSSGSGASPAPALLDWVQPAPAAVSAIISAFSERASLDKASSQTHDSFSCSRFPWAGVTGRKRH